jgi:hypothetical protein
VTRAISRKAGACSASGRTQNRNVAAAASKRAVGEIEAGDIHLAELDLGAEPVPSPLGPPQHRRADVDADHRRARRVEGDVAPGSDPGVEQPARQPLEQQRPDPPIPPDLERQVEQIVERRDALVSAERTQTVLSPGWRAAAPKCHPRHCQPRRRALL